MFIAGVGFLLEFQTITLTFPNYWSTDCPWLQWLVVWVGRFSLYWLLLLLYPNKQTPYNGWHICGLVTIASTKKKHTQFFYSCGVILTPIKASPYFHIPTPFPCLLWSLCLTSLIDSDMMCFCNEYRCAELHANDCVSMFALCFGYSMSSSIWLSCSRYIET